MDVEKELKRLHNLLELQFGQILGTQWALQAVIESLPDPDRAGESVRETIEIAMAKGLASAQTSQLQLEGIEGVLRTVLPPHMRPAPRDSA